MAVACGSGVVESEGVPLSPHFSTVSSLLHSDTRISSKIKSNDYFGTTVWSGNSPVIGQLRDIPKSFRR